MKHGASTAVSLFKRDVRATHITLNICDRIRMMKPAISIWDVFYEFGIPKPPSPETNMDPQNRWFGEDLEKVIPFKYGIMVGIHLKFP